MIDDQKAGVSHTATAGPGVPACGAGEGAPAEARTDKPARTKPQRASKIKPRKFYLLGPMPHAKRSGKKLLNVNDRMRTGGTWRVGAFNMFERGFGDCSIHPRYQISRRLGRNVPDFERDGDYWMVSDKAKNVLARVSDSDFAFLAVDVVVDPGEEPKVFWFCDILPMLDAIDPERSSVPYTTRPDGSRMYSLGDGRDVFFHEAVAAPHHAFRLKSNPGVCVCDDVVRIAVREAKLTGFSFRETGKTPKRYRSQSSTGTWG